MADLSLSTRPYIQDPSAPDLIGPHAGGAAPARDDLDALFANDAQIDDVYDDVGANDTTAPANGRVVDLTGNDNGRVVNLDHRDDRMTEAGAGGLGIDEEVRVRKPRAPVAKLDEGRLLSAKGIPTLRRITKERLRFKGKGHEYSDVTRLLNLYQLWLDDLFPKAKFADGLALIEKLGHSKRMQVMRREWIDSEKPKPAEPEAEPEDDEFEDIDRTNDSEETRAQHVAGNGQHGDDNGPSGNDFEHTSDGNGAGNWSHADNDDDLYAMPEWQKEQRPLGRSGEGAMPEKPPADPDEDELDALLAEDAEGAVEAAGNKSTFGGLGERPRRGGLEPGEREVDDKDATDAMGDDW